MFGKLRVWDTEQNNGVLIYLLLADRSIEIVADRGLNRLLDWLRPEVPPRDVSGTVSGRQRVTAGRR